MKDLVNSIIIYKDYGTIKFDVKAIMDSKNITITQMTKRTGLHSQVVKRYYNGTVERYDKDVLSKFCYVLDCELNDIMYYEKSKDSIKL